MRYILVYICQFALTLACAVGVAWLLEFAAVEAYVAWYMNYYDIPVRAELSEDYGFGMLGFLVSLISIAVGFPLGAYLGWKTTSTCARLWKNV